MLSTTYNAELPVSLYINSTLSIPKFAGVGTDNCTDFIALTNVSISPKSLILLDIVSGLSNL